MRTLIRFLLVSAFLVMNAGWAFSGSYGLDETMAKRIQLKIKFDGKIKKSAPAFTATAFLDNGRMSIQFSEPLFNHSFHVSILNNHGEIVFDGEFTLHGEDEISFFFDYDEEDSYVIELSSRQGDLYGAF